MKDKSILLQVLFWFETVVAARILIFTMPVLISNYADKNPLIVSVEGWTMIALTLIAIYYFATGLSSILGLWGWRLFHYLGAALTIVLVFSLNNKSIELTGSAPYANFVPVVIALILSLIVFLNKGKKEKVTH